MGMVPSALTYRVRLIEDALTAGKHVLSQKPFVLDLADGEKLVALAGDGLRSFYGKGLLV